MNLKVGDHVSVLDEAIEGVVVHFDESSATIDCDGFEFTFQLEQLLKIGGDGTIEYKKRQPNIFGKNIFNEPQKTIKFKLNFNSNKPVFDLHLEAITEKPLFSNEYEKLKFQMDYVQEILRIANSKRKRNFVLIHGIGNGKLRNTIREYLKDSCRNVEYFDGNYQQFGGGATEIIIHQFYQNE